MPQSKRKSCTKAARATGTKKAPPPSTFITCGETGERIFVATATLSDLEYPPSCSSKRKVLYKIPSAKTRKTLYDELALVLEDCESRRLPKYGGRPWQVICRVSDNTQVKASPFFRWFRGSLELAVLPHLLEKIPEPPKFPGYIQSEQGVVRRVCKGDGSGDDEESEQEEQYDNMTEEEVHRMESLLSRDISTLSQAAWDHRNDTRLGSPLPTITLKWTCPLRQTFTSRKAAWDHALTLAEAELFVDRFLLGTGKTGAPLKPFRPTKAQALQAGKVRFLRDGLWVVGQEQGWQNERYLWMERKAHEKQQKKRCATTGITKAQLKETSEVVEATTEPPLKKRRKITGPSLFLSTNRAAFRERRLEELKQQPENHYTTSPDNMVVDRNGDPKKAKTASKVGLPTPQKKTTKPRKVTVHFTLIDAERELRVVWKNELSPEERNHWDSIANSSFQRKIDLDDEKRWDLAAEQGHEIDRIAEDESSAEEEKHERDSLKESESKTSADKNGKDKEGQDGSESDSMRLASEEERSLWEIFSEAEQKFWTKGSPSFVQSLGEGRKPFSTFFQELSPEYSACRRRVFDALFKLTPEEYEEYVLQNMRPVDRRKQIAEQRKQKELLAQGMKQLTDPALRSMAKRVNKWVTVAIQSARQAAKRMEAKAIPVIPPSNDPGGSKCDEDPELNTVLHIGACHCVPAYPSANVLSSTFNPISPSPPPDSSNTDGIEGAAALREPPTELARQNYENQDLPSIEQEQSASSIDYKEKVVEKLKEEEAEEDFPRFVPTNHFCLTEEQIKLCLDASMEHFEAVMRTVKARDLTRELVDGFDLLRERGRGRYDMELPAFDATKFDFLNNLKSTPWMPIVRQVLGDDVVLIHKGCFLSLPDATNQNYHQDGPHLHTTSQRPCHAVNVFIPLVDMTLQHGPTEFVLGSHVLGQEDWDRRYLETPLPKKGVPVMFDYRLGHRGLANTSTDPRPIIYCTYARAGDGKEFRDSVNFSRRRYRKLGDLIDKPMSREQRSKKRREQLDEQFWEEFPKALGSTGELS